MGKFKDMIKTWLDIKQDNSPKAITIHQSEDFEGSCIINKIWLRGDSNELQELHKQLNGKENSFWGSVPSAGMAIKKSHTGLPKLIIKTLTNIVMDNYNGVDIPNDSEWEEIAKDNNFDELLERAIHEAMAINDGAFKICYDPELTDKPILEWFSGDKVDLIYRRGRLYEVVFKSFYNKNNKCYMLKETYGYGYIKYKLYDGDKEVQLNTIDELKELEDLTFEKEVIWAIPLIFDKSIKYEGRGSSKFDGKLDAFDSLDEITSQWIESIRLGRTKTYIPENLIPKDPNTGMSIAPNPYDNQFIMTESDMREGSSSKVQVEQADIPSDKFLQTYMTYLDLALQGLISPSTLGIDTKKIQDANAQYERQMEKTTLYTRQSIIDVLTRVIPKVINTVLKSKDQMANNPPREDVDIDVLFGEYSTPSFDFQIDTISKAKMNGIMSLDTAIDELYGDSKDDEWKQEELKRLKEEQGIVEMNEPAVNQEVNFQEEWNKIKENSMIKGVRQKVLGTNEE